MKKLLFTLAFIIILSCDTSYGGAVSPSCTYKGIPLYGKVKVVNNFEDIKVKKVSNFEDIKVKEVSNFPNSCGRWQYVDNFEDFKIKFVDNFEDIKVRFVDNFEGI